MTKRPLKVAWISYFPVEWLPELPEPLRQVPRQHPASWQRVLLNEFKAMPQLKLEVINLRKHYPRTLTFEREGTTFHCLKVPGGARALSLFWWDTLVIRRRLKALQPDLVHAWGTERGAAVIASRLPYPYLVTMQGLLEWISQYVKLGAHDRLALHLERASLRRAAVATAESSFAVRWLRDHYPHLEVRPAEHAPDWLFHRVARQPQTQPLQLLSVGSMSLLKGTDLLVQGLDQLQQQVDFRLTLIGDCPPAFLDQLKRATSAGLWERITLRHGLTPPQIAEELARTTLLLFPTRVDNSPNAVKEAVAAGVPVVGSAVGGLLDYVVPGKNGFTFPAGDLGAFVQAVRTAVAHPLFSQGHVDPQTLRQMRDYLSPRTMGERFLAAYERVRTLRR